MTSYAEIERQATVFLTPSEPVLSGRFPRGEVTILAGEGGAGKGQMGIWLAVDTALQGHHVVVVTPEDDLQETVRPRLEATIGALAPNREGDEEFMLEVLSRIHDMTFTDSGAPFELSADGKHEGSIGQLRTLVDEHAVRLVVIDPLLACLAYGSIASNIGARRVIAPLQRLAKETGCALILTHHTVESGKVAGSKGLTDAARLVYRAKKDRENPGIRVLAIDKSNLTAEGDPVRYTIEGDGADTFIRWFDRQELTARRTAWRSETAKLPAAPDAARRAVMAWLSAGGGEFDECVRMTGLPAEAVSGALAELTAAGTVATKRRMAWPGRAAR